MASIDAGTEINRTRPMTREERKVILASSAGTIFEWYDFYLYGSLAAIIGAQFFTAFPEATRNVFALLAFAAGFIGVSNLMPGEVVSANGGRAELRLDLVADAQYLHDRFFTTS